MAKFEAGHDPADHTVAEVVEFLKGDEVTGDEYDRVVQAEREGRNRVGIMSGSGVEDPEPAAPPVAPEVDPDPVDGERQQQREVEAEASAAGTDRALTKAQLAAQPVDVQTGTHQAKTYTPEEAVRESVVLAHRWARPLAGAEQE